LEGKQAEARSRFETAINTSKGKKGPDPLVLNAVGRAIISAHSEKKPQDLDYAISKLNEAAQAAPTNADILLNLGNANRLKVKGGDAITAYNKSLQVSPTMAIAAYRAALLYKTHTSWLSPDGWNNVLDNLNAAVAADPKFAPAYEELYYYNLFAKKDMASAQNYSKLYAANADPSCDNKYLEMQVPIVDKKWADVITIGKQMIAECNGNPNPRVYRSMTVASLGLKDTTAACDYINQFFAKAGDDDILTSDYILRAQSCGRGNWEVMWTEINNAINSDTVLARQIRLINETLDEAKATGNQLFIAMLRMKSYQLRQSKGSPTSPTELVSYMAIPFYLGGAYQKSDSISNEYIKIAPDSIYGYYWSARALQAIDTGANQQGLFVPNFDKALTIALTDTARYKPLGVTAARTLAIYYANIKRDYPKAMEYVQKGKKLDAADPNLLNIEQLLQKYMNKKPGGTTPPKANNTPAAKAAPKTKPQTTGKTAGGK
jgi:tetratricopeptide (TPR) repeat protein